MLCQNMIMGSLKLHYSQVGISQNPRTQLLNPLFPTIIQIGTYKPLKTRTIRCGLRNIGPKKPMWRSRVLSKEAIQAVQALKLAKTSSKLDHVFNTRVSRLLKADLLDTLTELQRQSELVLSLQVFKFMKKESCYTPDLSIYYDMIMMLGKNKLIDKVEELFDELKQEGLRPDTRAYTELIGAYFQVSAVEKAMETYDQMKASGCTPDKLTLMIMVRNLEKAERKDLATLMKRDFEEYVDDPEKFLEQVEVKYARDPLVVV